MLHHMYRRQRATHHVLTYALQRSNRICQSLVKLLVSLHVHWVHTMYSLTSLCTGRSLRPCFHMWAGCDVLGDADVTPLCVVDLILHQANTSMCGKVCPWCTRETVIVSPPKSTLQSKAASTASASVVNHSSSGPWEMMNDIIKLHVKNM